MLFSDDNPLQVSPISKAQSGLNTKRVGGSGAGEVFIKHRRQKSEQENSLQKRRGKDASQDEEEGEEEPQKKGLLYSQ